MNSIICKARYFSRIIYITKYYDSRIIHKNIGVINNFRKYSNLYTTENNVIKSKHPDIIIRSGTIIDYIWENVGKWPDKTALVCGITDQSYTYAQTEKMCTAFAASLRNQLKLQDGDCVAVMLPNGLEFPLSTIGAIQAGCVVTTVNPIYKADEIARQLKMSKSKIIITIPSCYSEVKKALNLLKSNMPVILANTKDSLPEGAINFSEFAENFTQNVDCLKNVKPNSDDTVLLPFSSGTLGVPKGVQLTHRNIVANCMQGYTKGVTLAYQAIGDHQDVALSVLPFFHIYGLVVTLLTKLYVGTKIITLPKFTPDTYLNAQEKYKSNILFVVPPIVLFLTSHPKVKEIHLDPIRYMTCGAAPLAKSDIIRFMDKTKGNVSLLQGFGMTEASPVLLMQEKTAKNYASVGGPIANTEAKIVDLNDENIAHPANIEGELWVRGPQIMKGYLENPEANKDIFRPDGWMRTGDIAYYDENHDFYITERLKELIKVKGFQVAPAELEAILRNHPDLDEAVVVGIPHPQHGETPKAFVVKKTGSTPTADSIKEFVASKVTSYKKINDVVFVESIPKNSAGKILRREVKAKFA